MWLSRLLVYATHRESEDHVASKPRPGVLYKSSSSLVALPDATSMVHRFRWLSSTSSDFPFGDHSSSEKKPEPGSGTARGVLSPDWSAIISWSSPLASEIHANCPPSGDQTGFRSCVPGDFVRLRQSPLSAGTVKMSPRASNAARTPVGERLASRIMLATRLNCGRAQGKSPTTSIASCFDWPLLMSNRWMKPFCS